MFKVDKNYIHNQGKDAVIRIHGCKDMGSGYELTVTWHCLTFNGNVLPRATSLQFIFVSKKDSSYWNEYKDGDRSYA